MFKYCKTVGVHPGGSNTSYSPYTKCPGMKTFTGYRCPAADAVRMSLGTSKATGCEWGKAHVHWGFPTEGRPQALQISAFDFDQSVQGFTAPMLEEVRVVLAASLSLSSCLEHRPLDISGVPLTSWRISEGRSLHFKRRLANAL